MAQGLLFDQYSAAFSVCGRIGRFLVYITLISLIGPAFSWAQNPTTAAIDETASDEIEEIVVTGSRLLRRDFTAPSPITTIDRDMLDYSSQPTLEAMLNQMPQVTPDLTRSINNGGDGTARVNLRGFGAHRTLVMLNGRRLSPSGIGTAVDINNLPQALIDRVEVITGGATTVYGSDAVAGVVNFITRDDFEGFGLETSGYATEESDSRIVDFNVTYGHNFASGRGNIRLFGGYYDREELRANDREISSVPWSDMWDGTLQQGGSIRTPAGVVLFPTADLGNGPVRVTFDTDGNPREFMDPEDRYNWAPDNYIQTPLTRYTGGIFLNYDVSSRAEIYVEAARTRNEWQAQFAPVPTAQFFVFSTDNPIMTPATQQVFVDNYIPVGASQVMAYMTRRLVEIGPRIVQENKDYTRIAAGIRGDLWTNWEFDAWATFTKSDEETLQRNDGSKSRFQQGLLVDPVTGQCLDRSNGCVPINWFGAGNMSHEVADFIRLPPLVNTTTRDQVLVSAFIRGKLFDGWAGGVQSAFGIEWREDDGDFKADDYLFSGDTLGFPGKSPVVGSESVYEVYAELLLPLASDAAFAEYLGLEIGGRYSDYDHAGGVDTWKAGLDWQINSALRFRGMVQRSVRAPNLHELFEEQVRDDRVVVPEADPCSASADPVAAGNVEACIATGLPADQIGIFEASEFPYVWVRGGNPELEPEIAETVTAGFIISPEWVPALQLAVDYFELELEGGIDNLNADIACFDPANVDNLFCDAFSRDPVTYNIGEIRETLINRGILKTTGVDTQIKYATDLPAALSIGGAGADLDVSINWTHVSESSFQATPWGTTVECAGYYGWPCSGSVGWTQTFPADRVTTIMSYASGKVSGHLTWRWIDGTDNAASQGAAFAGLDEPDLAIPSIGRKNYVDLGVGYQFNDNFTGRLVIANLTDTDPPLMADAVRGNNTDTSMFDIYGRSYTLSFSLNY